MKRIAIFGSTGSIGTSLLKIIKDDKKNFKIELLTANKNYKKLIKQAKFFNVKNLVITDYNSYVNPDKKVLIEDFTGHTCPNCPDAARELEAIHAIYGDQIIGMALHVSKAFARPYPSSQTPKFQYDFRTKWGDDWDAFYGISDIGLPRGMVNRTLYPDGHTLGKGEWADAVALELKKDIDFKISIIANNTLISVTTEVVNNINNIYNIIVCLTESNIINWQKDGQIEVEDYEHNHVLRSVIIDESLSYNQSFVVGEIIEKSYSINLSDLEQYNIDYSTNTAELGNGIAGGWVSENLSVVAYIYNTSTMEIVQVEEAHLIN
jgi:thiol-disulfide isomerase/thioredoxin